MRYPRSYFADPLRRQRAEPPTPRATVFVDRTTGTQYLLSHDSEADTVALTTPVSSRVNARPSEPLVWTPFGMLRLFVDNGELGTELSGDTVLDGPVFTLNLTERRTTYEVHGRDMIAANGPLCLRKYTGLGRTSAIEDLGCVVFVGAGILDTAGNFILDTAGRSIGDTTG